MLFFRSEEQLEAWRAARGLPAAGKMSLERMWQLANAWYHDRLERGWRRKTSAEAKGVFEELGLTGEFWALR